MSAGRNERNVPVEVDRVRNPVNSACEEDQACCSGYQETVLYAFVPERQKERDQSDPGERPEAYDGKGRCKQQP